MLKISHRGNLKGPRPADENKPLYIEQALTAGSYVEVDIWETDNGFYLGHDEPQYPVTDDWVRDRSGRCIFHCKNSFAIPKMQKLNAHWFTHENDAYAITSYGWVWTTNAVPEKTHLAILVMPELSNIPSINFMGVCSDYQDIT